MDYGNIDYDIPLNELVHIPLDLETIPFQAMEFVLCEVGLFPSIPQELSKKALKKILLAVDNNVKVKIFSVVSDRYLCQNFLFKCPIYSFMEHILFKYGKP